MVNSELEITLAKEIDLDRILEIYGIAKAYMRKNGNPNQWNGGYPDRETLEMDIEKQRLYVCKEDGVIQGVFVLLMEKEETYDYVEGGQWLNEEPYGTIHRIASSGEVRGIFKACLDFARERVANVRVDTHHDNHTMQYLAEKYGFRKCGIIYLKSGSPRLAYHYVGH